MKKIKYRLRISALLLFAILIAGCNKVSSRQDGGVAYPIMVVMQSLFQVELKDSDTFLISQSIEEHFDGTEDLKPTLRAIPLVSNDPNIEIDLIEVNDALVFQFRGRLNDGSYYQSVYVGFRPSPGEGSLKVTCNAHYFVDNYLRYLKGER